MIQEEFLTVHGMPTPPLHPALIIPLAAGGIIGTGWLMGKTAKAIEVGVDLGKVMTNMLLPLIPAGIGLALMLAGKTEFERKIGIMTMIGGGAVALIVSISMLKK